MKIAIVTFHASKNFGAVLQSFALQSALELMGHEPCFVHIRSDHQLVSKYRRKQKLTPKGIFRSIAFKLMQSKLDARIAKFNHFLENRLKTTRRYTSMEDLMADPPQVDAYICGSDQIWNLEKGLSKYLFLGAAPDNVRKISYAPSFGTPDIPSEHNEEVASLINRIEYLSVREHQAVELVRDLTGRQAVQVCDPVFLLDKSFWENIAIKPSFSRPYMVFYSLSSTPDLSACVSHLSSRFKLPVVVLAKGGAFIFRNKTILAVDSGPEEFLGWIRHANLVVTNSFHATAFSIHFEVPFVTIAHTTRNTRMESLLTCYKLSERMVADSEALRASDVNWIDKPFNESSRAAAEQLRVRSHAFLVKATSA